MLVYVVCNNGIFCESETPQDLGYIHCRLINSVNYRNEMIIDISNLKIPFYNWKFNPIIYVIESGNFKDAYQLKFCVDCESPSGKKYKIEFYERYLNTPNNEKSTAIASILTSIYLIATTGTPEWAQDIYKYILSHPSLPANEAAFTFAYTRALNDLLSHKY